MNAKELRIGNWIYAFPNKEPIQVVGVLCDMVETMKGGATLENIDPISLTEEILLKCGFEKEPMAYSINIDSFGGGKKLLFSGDYLYIVYSEKKNTIPTDVITIWNKDLRKEFYLHQLQNIFHALTNTELNIKL